MTRPRHVILGIVAVAASLALAGVAGGGDRTWTDGEIRTLRSLWIGSVGDAPPDPSNRHADNPQAAALGRRLFFDKRLSRNGEVSCATCHRPELYFTDGLPRSTALGKTRRGAPTLIGTGYGTWFYWDGRRDSAWAQALAPLEAAEEMGGTRVRQIRLIAADPGYRLEYETLFGSLPELADRSRFPERAGPLGTPAEQAAWKKMSEPDRVAINRAYSNLGKALAAYQRKLVPGPSRFDRYVANGPGDPELESSLSPDEIAGLRLFVSPEVQCLRCHNGPLFTNGGFHNIGVPPRRGQPLDYGRFAAIEEVLDHEFNCIGPYSDADPSLCVELRFIKKAGEELPGAFKVPTLRNVAETAPYLHTGSFESLAELLEHYRSPRPALGHLELDPLRLTDEQLRQIELFLGTLTSPVAADPEWLTPPGNSAKDD